MILTEEDYEAHRHAYNDGVGHVSSLRAAADTLVARLVKATSFTVVSKSWSEAPAFLGLPAGAFITTDQLAALPVPPAIATLGYYRHPDVDGELECERCGYIMHEHGWLDWGSDGTTVCPSTTGPFEGQSTTERGRARYGYRDITLADVREGMTVRVKRGHVILMGVAHHQGAGVGNWATEDGWWLTWDDNWPLSTPDPLPDPEPTPAERLARALTSVDLTAWSTGTAQELLNLIDASGLKIVPKAES